MGRVFRPTYTNKQQSEAKKLLKRRLGESGTGKLLLAEVAKTTFADLKKMITDDYANNDRESADQLKVVLKRLDEGFANLKATDITKSPSNHHGILQDFGPSRRLVFACI